MVDQDSSRIKPRCKVGDLAFVIKAEKHHSNLGKIVKFIREAKPIVDFADEYNGLVWMVESEGGLLESILFPSGKIDRFPVRPYRDNCLLPIRPAAKKRATKRVTETSEEGSI